MVQWIVLLGVLASFVGAATVMRRAAHVDGFYAGRDAHGGGPGLWTLILSQVTTWIFARSLLNAAILGYYYGIAGTLAYTAYYLSFLTGGWAVGRLRAQGHGSVQNWLAARFGIMGTSGYNVVIGLRLLSEVFANLLVIGLIAKVLFPDLTWASPVAIVVISVLTLVYSAWGGLHAALKTDVFQMIVFLIVFGWAFLYLVLSPGFDLAAVLTSSGVAGGYNGWILLAVAFLQVPSYPIHDPVMMDRGFLADEKTTQKSFYGAFVISAASIFGFGIFGIQAAEVGAKIDADLLGTWSTMFPATIFGALLVSLFISGVSTLDSALASASRLMIEELRILPRTLGAGRFVMAAFLGVGGILTLWGNATLFDAVAVSGTASMFLTPIIFTAWILHRAVAPWAFAVSFAAAIGGAVLYFARSNDWAMAILPQAHKYEQLLVICVVVLGIGFLACLAGSQRVAKTDQP